MCLPGHKSAGLVYTNLSERDQWMCFVKPFCLLCFLHLRSCSLLRTEEADSSWVKASWGSCPICHLETLHHTMSCLLAFCTCRKGTHCSYYWVFMERVTANELDFFGPSVPSISADHFHCAHESQGKGKVRKYLVGQRKEPA